MNLFICTSDPVGDIIGHSLCSWLRNLFDGVRPFSEPAGSTPNPSREEMIRSAMECADFVVVCMTPRSSRSERLHREAAALSRVVGQQRVFLLRFQIDSGVDLGPMKHWKSSEYSEQGVVDLVRQLNTELRELDRDRIRSLCASGWPRLDENVTAGLVRLAMAAPTASRPELQGFDGLRLTDVHITLRDHGQLKAFARIVLNGCCTVRGFMIVDPLSGPLIVKNPSREPGGREIFMMTGPVSTDWLHDEILAKYREAVALAEDPPS